MPNSRKSHDFGMDQIQNFNESYGADDAYDSIFRNETPLRPPQAEEEKRCNTRMIVAVFTLAIISFTLLSNADVGGQIVGIDRYPPGDENIYESNLRPYGSELMDTNQENDKIHADEGSDVPSQESGIENTIPDEEVSVEQGSTGYLLEENAVEEEPQIKTKEKAGLFDKLFKKDTPESNGEDQHVQEEVNSSNEDLFGIETNEDVEDTGEVMDDNEGSHNPDDVEKNEEVTSNADNPTSSTSGEEIESNQEEIDTEKNEEVSSNADNPTSSTSGEEIEVNQEEIDTAYPEFVVEKNEDFMLGSNPLYPYAQEDHTSSTLVDHTHDVYDPFHKGHSTTVHQEGEIQAGIEDQNDQPPTLPEVPSFPEQDVTDTIQPYLSLQYKFADIKKPYVPGIDVPFFWYIPRTAGTSVESMLTKCHNMVGAGNKGGINGAATKPYLEVFEPFPGENFVNVELRSPKGIQRAIELDIIGSGLVDAVFASRLYQVKDIFHPPKNQGRYFTLFRHPVERAVSLFYYLKDASHENSYNQEISAMTIEDYVVSSKVESDWMVRSLVGKLEGGRVTEDDLFHAMGFIESKCLIGLTSKYSESYKRFENYFELGPSNNINCENKVMGELARQASSHPKIAPNSEAWQKLEERNQFDLKLYNYALQLFEEQKKIAG